MVDFLNSRLRGKKSKPVTRETLIKSIEDPRKAADNLLLMPLKRIAWALAVRGAQMAARMLDLSA